MDKVVTINFNQVRRDLTDKFIENLLCHSDTYFDFSSFDEKEERIIEIERMIYDYNEEIKIVEMFFKLLERMYPFLDGELSDTESEVNVCEVSEEK